MLVEVGSVLLPGLKFGAIYALAALGLVVVHKATKTVNFAHGAFAMLGAFASFLIVVHWQWPYWTAYLLIPLTIGVVAALLEFLVLRPLRRADMFTVVIATVFLGIALARGLPADLQHGIAGRAGDVRRRAASCSAASSSPGDACG